MYFVRYFVSMTTMGVPMSLGFFIRNIFNYFVQPHIEQLVDCGRPELIEFGSVDVTSTTEDSVALYTCIGGYRLRGTSIRTCLSSGKWSGTVPFCSSKLDTQNTLIEHTQFV